MEHLTQSWSLFVLPGGLPPPHLRNAWEKTYAVWHSVWKEAFQELEGSSELYSDEFTRQQNILAVFEGDQCLLSIFFREVDVGLKGHREDSYFKVWPEKCLAQLEEDYQGKILIGSNTTVAQHARGNYQGVSLKRLLTGLSVKFLVESPLEALVGTMRNNKGMNTVTYEAGAKLLEAGLLHHGVEVDLVVFEKQILKDIPHQYQALIDRLWRERWDHRMPAQSKMRAA